ncbi:MAG: TrkH family potassium uptake protein, partial [Sinomicrobium sp.]|nr:TrkH family potassium uptake protein [Sinomicrobium sp.]
TAGLTLNISIKQAFLLTFSSWFVVAAFAALPFYFSSLNLSATDAFFEAMSGITTTGATVIVGLDHAPAGILFWRGILQWLGGVGIIIMAMSILPFLNVGGMQLFRTELAEREKALPRATRLTSSIGMIYLALTMACAILYMLSGMEVFDAVVHAMTTISTGGFSTFDSSFMHYDSSLPQLVAVVFMILGGMPFVLYLKAVRGSFRPLFDDPQVRWFLLIISGVSFVIMVRLIFFRNFDLGHAAVTSLFTVVSTMTGTGFVDTDYNSWSSFSTSILLFLMAAGGCVGSTTCGIKIFRFQVLYEVCRVQVKGLLYPHGVFLPYYNKKPLPPDVPVSVMGFFFVYALVFSLLCMALSLTGLDFTASFSGAIACLSNAGPGLGPIIGPLGSYQDVPEMAKVLLAGGMLLGRMELFTALVMLSPTFWRR